MINIIKTFYFLSIFLVLFTLAKDISFFRIYLFDFAFIPCVFFVFVNGLLRPRACKFRWQRIDSLFIALLASVTVAFVFSEDRVRSIVSYMDWWRIIGIYFTSRIVFSNEISDSFWRRLVWFSVIVLLIIGCIQALTGTKFGLIGNYFGVGLDQGIAANVKGVGSRLRVSGTTTNPIIFAIWVTMFSLLAASYLIANRHHVSYVVLSFTSAFVVISTLSRGAIAAFAFSWLILVLVNYRELVRMVLVSMFCMVFIIPSVYFMVKKSNIEDAFTMLKARIERQELLEEDSSRMRTMKMGLSLMHEPKVFFAGTGPDNLVMAYRKYKSNILNSSHHTHSFYHRSGVHNVWIKMFVEYGIMSGLLLIFIWLDLILRTFWLWKRRAYNPSTKLWAGFSLAFFIPYLMIDCSVYESAMSYHILNPLMAIIGYVVTLTTVTEIRNKRVSKHFSYTTSLPLPNTNLY